MKKSNSLNEMIVKGMTLQELRFFSIYLSKIDSNDIETRMVRFPLDDFRKVMELGRLNIEYMKLVTNKLLGKVVNVPNDLGGYTGFQLFKECVVGRDKYNQWFIEIDAHDKALPLMFEIKAKFFSYKLWNVLQLKSVNQIRMYEFLKQYEFLGERITSVDALKQSLGIAKKEYDRFGNFRHWVLDVCQDALKKYTDIKFTYEPYGGRGKGGKILFLKFVIEKNADYQDKLSLEEFIGKQQLAELVNDTAHVNATEHTEETNNEANIYSLSFIKEDVSEKDLISILNAAHGDVDLIRDCYAIARTKSLNNLVGFLLWAVKQPKESITADIRHQTESPKRKNKFANFEERDIDYDIIEVQEQMLLFLDALEDAKKENNEEEIKQVTVVLANLEERRKAIEARSQ